MGMKKKILSRCPVCGGEMEIVSFRCKDCGTLIQGEFPIPPVFVNLTEEQWNFVKLFIKNRGNIKEMEKDLGISYPTIRAKLNEIRRVFGFSEEKGEREDILEGLEKGKLTVEEAIKKLKR